MQINSNKIFANLLRDTKIIFFFHLTSFFIVRLCALKIHTEWSKFPSQFRWILFRRKQERFFFFFNCILGNGFRISTKDSETSIVVDWNFSSLRFHNDKMFLTHAVCMRVQRDLWAKEISIASTSESDTFSVYLWITYHYTRMLLRTIIIIILFE